MSSSPRWMWELGSGRRWLCPSLQGCAEKRGGEAGNHCGLRRVGLEALFPFHRAEVKPKAFSPGTPRQTGCSTDPEMYVVMWAGGRGKHSVFGTESLEAQVQGASCALGGPSDSSVTLTGGEPWPARAFGVSERCPPILLSPSCWEPESNPPPP